MKVLHTKMRMKKKKKREINRYSTPEYVSNYDTINIFKKKRRKKMKKKRRKENLFETHFHCIVLYCCDKDEL